MKSSVFLFVLAVLLLGGAPAQAHRLKLFLSGEGAEITGSVYFAGGGKAGQVHGEVLDDQGRVVAPLVTDDQGAFVWTRPDGRFYRIRFETADGHMAESVLGTAETETQPVNAVAALPVTGDVEIAIARQIKPLREQIDALDSRTRLSDVIGGIGLIFGLFGCYAWVASRRKGTS